MKLYIFFAIGALCFAPLWVQGGNKQAMVLKKAPLNDSPYSDSKNIYSVPAKTKVEVLQIKGGWAQVNFGQKIGWVRIYNLKLEGAEHLTPASDLKSLSRSPVVATGVKGLTEEDLKNLRPAPQLVRGLDKFLPTNQELKEFADQGGLKLLGAGK